MATAEAMAQKAGWSSLPADLVNRVADCLLATNDLDYYMDLRAVCHGWRSSTADPKTASHDVRFHPTRWIVLEELSQSDTARLFVHADTGRFLRRNLPLLRDFHHVTSTAGGFLVLADMEPPHAALLLNPFTGCLTRFKAAMPSEFNMAADVVGPSPVLVVFNSLTDEFHMCDLALDKEEGIAEAHIYPASIPQLLVEYTMCAPSYKPALDKFKQEIEYVVSFCLKEVILQLLDDMGDLEDGEYYPFDDYFSFVFALFCIRPISAYLPRVASSPFCSDGLLLFRSSFGFLIPVILTSSLL